LQNPGHIDAKWVRVLQDAAMARLVAVPSLSLPASLHKIGKGPITALLLLFI
jgi:hypothetical protein